VLAIREEGLAIGEEGLAIREEGLAIRQEGLAIREEGLAIRKEGLAIGEERLAIRKEGLAIRENKIIKTNFISIIIICGEVGDTTNFLQRRRKFRECERSQVLQVCPCGKDNCFEASWGFRK
jgi:hypothetical protein